jgi:hypothetical protein
MVNNIDASEEALFNFFICVVSYSCDKDLVHELHKLEQICKNSSSYTSISVSPTWSIGHP